MSSNLLTTTIFARPDVVAPGWQHTAAQAQVQTWFPAVHAQTQHVRTRPAARSPRRGDAQPPTWLAALLFQPAWMAAIDWHRQQRRTPSGRQVDVLRAFLHRVVGGVSMFEPRVSPAVPETYELYRAASRPRLVPQLHETIGQIPSRFAVLPQFMVSALQHQQVYRSLARPRLVNVHTAPPNVVILETLPAFGPHLTVAAQWLQVPPSARRKFLSVFHETVGHGTLIFTTLPAFSVDLVPASIAQTQQYRSAAMPQLQQRHTTQPDVALRVSLPELDPQLIVAALMQVQAYRSHARASLHAVHLTQPQGAGWREEAFRQELVTWMASVHAQAQHSRSAAQPRLALLTATEPSTIGGYVYVPFQDAFNVDRLGGILTQLQQFRLREGPSLERRVHLTTPLPDWLQIGADVDIVQIMVAAAAQLQQYRAAGPAQLSSRLQTEPLERQEWLIAFLDAILSGQAATFQGPLQPVWTPAASRLDRWRHGPWADMWFPSWARDLLDLPDASPGPASIILYIGNLPLP